MKIAALITGRGNNTLKNKNILPILGKPLLSYPASEAKRIAQIDEYYISSDDQKILDIGAGLGYKKILRPPELATPTAQHIDTIVHGLEYMRSIDDFSPDILIVFLANSLTVKAEWIKQSIDMIVEDPTISSVVPVFQDQDHHPYRAKRLNGDGSLEPFFDFSGTEVSTNRQDLEPCFFLCHNFWVLNVDISIMGQGGQKPWVFLGNNIKPIMVEECFDVHTNEDLVRCENWLKKNNMLELVNG